MSANQKKEQNEDLENHDPVKYGLPADYKQNLVLDTMDTVTGRNYWTEKRLQASYSYQYPVYEYARRFIQKNGLKTLVDVGCGPATKMIDIHNHCKDVKIIGIDQESPIELCKERYDFGEWYVDDFENPRTDLPEIKGDLVVCADVIEHVLNPGKLLDYIRNHVAPGGHVLLSTPDRMTLYGPDMMVSGNVSHVREWTAQEFKTYLESQGFEVLEQFHTYPVRPGPNIMFLKKFLYQSLNGHGVKTNQVCLAKVA